MALPLYEGRIVGQFDFSSQGWESGSGRTAVWRQQSWTQKVINPQYLMGSQTYSLNSGIFQQQCGEMLNKLLFMDVTAATNSRTAISCVAGNMPCGNSAPVLRLPKYAIPASVALNSLVFDMAARKRCTGLHLNWFIMSETPLPQKNFLAHVLEAIGIRLNLSAPLFSSVHLRQLVSASWRSYWSLSESERLRLRCIADACVADTYGLDCGDFAWLLKDCDHPAGDIPVNVTPTGFWRVDKDKLPEHRHTVLTLVAFHDLQEKIAACGGDVERGIEAFCAQNDGEGWMLPETLRLADYGLGHDDRAKEHQPVRACFGPRFYDWQLAQSPEESWRECHLHARNLLGPDGYQALLDELEGKAPANAPVNTPKTPSTPRKTESRDAQGQLLLGGRGFDEDIPLLADTAEKKD